MLPPPSAPSQLWAKTLCRTYYLTSCLNTNLRRDFLLHHFMPIISSRSLSETEVIKTDHSRKAFSKFTWLYNFFFKAIPTHVRVGKISFLQQNCYVDIITICKISRLSWIYFIRFTNYKMAHFAKLILFTIPYIQNKKHTHNISFQFSHWSHYLVLKTHLPLLLWQEFLRETHQIWPSRFYLPL